MSFNFNWEPLLYVDGSASPNEFYEKAKELLTAALNKPSKPPIIVDDIVVSDLNLGKEAPRLDVLEIGDIASDRFRGVFKLSYNGDACIKLSTKVQVSWRCSAGVKQCWIDQRFLTFLLGQSIAYLPLHHPRLHLTYSARR